MGMQHGHKEGTSVSPLEVVEILFPPSERAAFRERCECHFFARDAPIPDVARRLITLMAEPQTPRVAQLRMIVIIFLRRRGLGALPFGVNQP